MRGFCSSLRDLAYLPLPQQAVRRISVSYLKLSINAEASFIAFANPEASHFHLHNLVLPGLGQYGGAMVPEKGANVKEVR